jgi:hypothetical protein
MDSPRFAAYFSHSWHPRDVEINLAVWEEISKECELLVDVPEEPGAEPAYHINRIEELLRRSDLFVCVLTYRDKPAGSGAGDGALRCSAYSLFEIRLAERFRLPRLVMYERKTGFKSPLRTRPGEIYMAFDRGADALPEQRQWRNTTGPNIRQWIDWATDHRKPASYEPSALAVSLIPPDAPDGDEVKAALRETLREAGYERVSFNSAHENNTEAFQILGAAGLVIADLSSENPATRQIFSAAHGQCIPAIRTMREEKPLPWLLEGHPGGYQLDIARWKTPADLAAAIAPRARSMFRVSNALGEKEARRYLNSKRYAKFLVFLSHTLKPPNRDLVEAVFEKLAECYVRPFEYHLVNTSGSDWKAELSEQLNRTTHFVALLTDGYELSPVCTYEMEEILKRGSDVKIFPFMAGGRSVPHPKLGHLHHRLLSGKDAGADAEVVAKEVMEALTAGGG